MLPVQPAARRRLLDRERRPLRNREVAREGDGDAAGRGDRRARGRSLRRHPSTARHAERARRALGDDAFVPAPGGRARSRRSASTRCSPTTTGSRRSRSSARERAASGAGPTLLGALIDVVTTLDPWVRPPLPLRGGLAHRRRARACARRTSCSSAASSTTRDDWRNRFYLGFNHFFYLDEYEQAAAVLEEAIELPGAPLYLRRLVARLKRATAGEPRGSPRPSCTSCCSRAQTRGRARAVREGARRDRDRAPGARSSTRRASATWSATAATSRRSRISCAVRPPVLRALPRGAPRRRLDARRRRRGRSSPTCSATATRPRSTR